MCYSVQPRDQIFVKGYRFLSFAKQNGGNHGKDISKNSSGKCNQKLLDYTKQPATDALKAVSKRAIQKIVDPAGDLIGNKIADRITKVSKSSQQNNLETVTNEHDKEIVKERYISPEEKQKIIHDLRLI